MYGNPPFDQTSSYEERECGGPLSADYAAFQTLDLTADGVPDLVVSRDDCHDPDAGTTHWNVYAGGPSGFAASPFAWPLPSLPWTPDYDGLAFDALYDFQPITCGGLRERYANHAATDLTGDGILDLVFLRDDCTDDVTIGRERWVVYAAECEIGRGT